MYKRQLLGRILQGASAGIVGVVVPLYLAECLSAESRGKGTGMFQFLLTVGLVFAAVVGLLAASYVGGVDVYKRQPQGPCTGQTRRLQPHRGP